MKSYERKQLKEAKKAHAKLSKEDKSRMGDEIIGQILRAKTPNWQSLKLSSSTKDWPSLQLGK